jgi:PTS system mannose-specific IIB component/fructoselysine and glucoselysine-specific PTS system IIB component
LSLALLRVDDRLIHGQVLLGWGPVLEPARYVVVDDGLASDPFERALLEASAGGTPVEVLTIELAAPRLAALAPSGEPTVVLVRALPEAARLALALARAGAPPLAINLGGLHYAPGKTRVHDVVYLDRADRAALAALADLGVRVVVQDVPATRPFDAPPDWQEEPA